jgi:mannose-6-phosphate isomerase
MTDRQRVYRSKKMIKAIADLIEELSLEIEETDFDRPWGAFYKIKNHEAERFIDAHFSDIKHEFCSFDNLSPKYLIIAPRTSLSWQYHHRREEIWRVMKNRVRIKVSDADDLPNEHQELIEGDTVYLKARQRHRIIGGEEWAVVVEIWRHTDPDNLSDEEDIVRIQDDFGR